jgi:hypothetical protein
VISIKDIHWAAGLLEGEGCFYERKPPHFQPQVVCNMIDETPIRKLFFLFGGKLSPKWVDERLSRQPQLEWRVYGSRAIGIMMTLYPLLCRRRQLKIEEMLKNWKSRPHARRHNRAAVAPVSVLELA